MPRLLRVVLPALLLAAAFASTADARTAWLCRPGIAEDPCTFSRATTAVAADGTHERVGYPAHRGPRVDCFYVYPTVTSQPTVAATATRDPSVIAVAELQASRFSQVCDVYAPLYRQLTVGGLTAGPDQVRPAVDRAYRDVRAAWRTYLRRFNDGRGVILIGHSQGTGMLTRLVQQEIDDRRAVRRRLVSALLIGGNVMVPAGEDVGGSFQHVPACRSFTQLGCVVAYNAFLQTPPNPSLFGRGPASGFGVPFPNPAKGADLETLCVDPAQPAGGSGALNGFFRTTPGEGIATPWTTYPGRYRGRCERADGASWLQVDPQPDDPRPVVTEALGPIWGLHLFDISIALGDLVRLTGIQAITYLNR